MTLLIDIRAYAQAKLDKAATKSEAFLSEKEKHAIRWATAYSKNFRLLLILNQKKQEPTIQRFINEPEEPGWNQ